MIAAPMIVEVMANRVIVMDGGVAVKCDGGGAVDAHWQQFALVTLVAVEEHDLVGARAAEHAFASLLATTFDKDFNGLANQFWFLRAMRLLRISKII